MCEIKKCPHPAADLCSCPPVRNKKKDIFRLVEHITANMTDIRWELD